MDRTLALIAPLVFAVGCSGTNGSNGTNGTNGTSGTNGKNGTSELVNVVDEPAGTNCPYGGKAIEVGVDTNGDGVLEANEVTSTSYVCANTPPALTKIEGSFIINNSADVATLGAVTEITGTLFVEGTGSFGVPLATGGIASISLPALTHVGGLTVTAASDLTSLSLPALATIDHDLAVNASGLSTLDLSSLTSVQNLTLKNVQLADLSGLAKLGASPVSIVITDATQLTTLDGMEAALARPNTTIDLEDDIALADVSALSGVTSPATLVMRDLAITTLSLDAMTTTPGDLRVEKNDALTSVSFAKLTSVGVLSIDEEPLTALSAPLLAQATGYVSIGQIPLAKLSLPALTTTPELFIVQSAQLTSIDLPQLTSVADTFEILSNPNLPECQVDAVVAQLTTVGTVYTSGNGSGTCP